MSQDRQTPPSISGSTFSIRQVFRDPEAKAESPKSAEYKALEGMFLSLIRVLASQPSFPSGTLMDDLWGYARQMYESGDKRSKQAAHLMLLLHAALQAQAFGVPDEESS